MKHLGGVFYVDGVPAAVDFEFVGNVPLCVDSRNGDIYALLYGTSPFNVIRKVSGGSVPVTVTDAAYTVAVTADSVIANRAGTVTLTLPSASVYPGRSITVRTIQAQAVISAASDVVPLAGGAAGTAILAATAGKWARLVSDANSWQVMEAA